MDINVSHDILSAYQKYEEMQIKPKGVSDKYQQLAKTHPASTVFSFYLERLSYESADPSNEVVELVLKSALKIDER